MYQKVLATTLFVVALCLGDNVQAYVFDHNPPPPEPYVVADDLPDGNYMESCRACHINHNGNLSCRCLTSAQNLVPAVFPLDDRCQFIENHNGHLVCTGWQEAYYRPHHHYHHDRYYHGGPDVVAVGVNVRG